MVEGPNTMYSVSRRTLRTHREDEKSYCNIWLVVKIKVPFWVPIIIRHLLFRVPKKDPNFDNHPYVVIKTTVMQNLI